MEYIRKPSKISRERTTVLVDGILTGENGASIRVQDIVTMHYNERFDGVAKLFVADEKSKIAISSHCVENGTLVQKTEVINAFLEELKSQISHPYTFITGSNLLFGFGIVLVVFGLLVSSIVVYAIISGDELPRGSLSGIGLIIAGIFVSRRGRARRQAIAHTAQQGSQAGVFGAG